MSFITSVQLKNLKKRWNIESNYQLTMILIVFAVNGSVSGKLAKPLLSLFDITKEGIGWYLYYPLAAIIVFPVYFSLMPLTSWIFGQFKFFWAFEKKTLSRMGLGFLFKKKLPQ